jgi:hypothetical protein
MKKYLCRRGFLTSKVGVGDAFQETKPLAAVVRRRRNPIRGAMGNNAVSRIRKTRHQKHEADRLRVLFQDTTKMNRLMDGLFGRGGWTYDPVEDVWIAPNSRGREF